MTFHLSATSTCICCSVATKSSLPNFRNHRHPSLRHRRRDAVCVKAFIFDPTDEPILKQALKEPVAFMGGMFAGIMRLDLNEDPLRDWVSRAVEASGGFTDQQIGKPGPEEEEEVPQQIVID